MKRILVLILVMVFLFSLSSCDMEYAEDFHDENDIIGDISPTAKEQTWIEMPKDSISYKGSLWTVEELTDYFKELGFSTIEIEPCAPDNDTFNYNIISVYINTAGWFGERSTKSWKKGEEFSSNSKIIIYYNSAPPLTKDNCEDLATILTCQDITWQDFVEKHDGRYVDFIGYVSHYDSYGWGAVIEVVGSSYVNTGEKGLTMYLGDETWGCSIDDGIKQGSIIHVAGMIDKEQSQILEKVYIETRFARLR